MAEDDPSFTKEPETGQIAIPVGVDHLALANVGRQRHATDSIQNRIGVLRRIVRARRFPYGRKLGPNRPNALGLADQ